MIEHPNDEDRRKLVVGDDAGALGPDEAAELALLTGVLGDPSTWVEPSADLEDAIVRAVANAPAAAGPTEAADRREVQSLRRRRAPSRRWRLASAATVAAAAAVAVGAIVVSLGGGASADFTAQLAATEVVPGAHASAAITRNAGGFRIVLDASGLSPLPAGQYYEAWLKRSSGTLVPVGTFSSSGDPVTLWSGVSPADFRTLTVTIEPDDNDQASSGKVVLVGTVQVKP